MGTAKSKDDSTHKQNETNEKNETQDDGILLSSEYDYMYAKRRCIYRAEQLEISPNEIQQIKALQCNTEMKYDPYTQITNLSKNGEAMKIIIDTDIGTDIDDVLTLLLLSHLPKSDVDVLGVTTNYRPTVLRKHITERILNQTKQNDHDLSSVPVIAGNCYLCGTHRPFFYAGNEGEGLGLDPNDSELMNRLWGNIQSENAEDFIYHQLTKYPQQITIISIGIPTNIGNLVQKYGAQKIESLIGHLVVMGGGNIMNQRAGFDHGGIGKFVGNQPTKWRSKQDLVKGDEIKEMEHPFALPVDNEQAIQWMKEQNLNHRNDADTETTESAESRNTRNVIHLFPNHNLSGDTLASVMMFGLKCPISVIPHHITQQNILRGKTIETLLKLAELSDTEKEQYVDRENGICGVLLREWFRVRHGQRSQCLHDPLTLYEALYCQRGGDAEEADDFVLQKESCLRYVSGTFVCHEWAAFLTFVPDSQGPHRLAIECKNPTKWVKWCGDTMINNVSKGNMSDDST